MMQPIELRVLDSRLGRFLLAATGQGLCRVALSTNGVDESTARSRLTARLERRFGAVELRPAGAALEDAARYLESFLAAPAQCGPYAGPLDPGGTAFQRRVWEVLRAIPAGRTRSYCEVAALAGSPGGARAAGAACGANPLLIFIPCHRVIGADRSLTGFGGGLELKRRLLEAENPVPTLPFNPPAAG